MPATVVLHHTIIDPTGQTPQPLAKTAELSHQRQLVPLPQLQAVLDPQPRQLVGSNGLSATVFEEVATGKRVLAIRGTDDLADVWTDFVDVAVLGTWERQAQYASLRSAVERWQADTGREAILDGDGRTFVQVKAARLGDSRWTQVMNHYYAAVRRELKTCADQVRVLMGRNPF